MSSSAERPVMFHRVLIGPFAHVVNTRVAYRETLENNETGKLSHNFTVSHYLKNNNKKGKKAHFLNPFMVDSFLNAKQSKETSAFMFFNNVKTIILTIKLKTPASSNKLRSHFMVLMSEVKVLRMISTVFSS